MALARWLPTLLLLAMAATTGADDDYVTTCYPPPTLAAEGGSEFRFRGNLFGLLEALPSAAAPTGFASLKTTGMATSDRAFVSGLCSSGSAPEPCRRCMTDAGKKMAEQCGDASRRASYWDERCFVDYTDNSPASAGDDFGAVSFSEDAIPRPDVVSVKMLVALAQSLALRAEKKYGSMVAAYATTPASKGDATTGDRTVVVGAKCERGRGAPDCARCLREASLAMARGWEAGGDAQGRFTWVRGSNCYLLFEIWTAPTLGEKMKTVGAAMLKAVVGGVLTGMVVGVLVFALTEVYDRMRMRAAAAAVAPAAVSG